MESINTPMVGREGEQAELAAFVTTAAGQALVLRGETGVGKTSLLGHAVALAEQEGHTIIRAAGVEAESELPYAGLHQFLHPLLSEVAQLDGGTRAVFDAVFGWAEGDPPSVMRLGIAVLSLLSLAAAQQPLLVVLDDGQWLDDSSADVCGFVGRRLAGSPVKLLIAVRTDMASRFDTAALPERSVAALADEDAALLLDRRYPRLGKQIRRTVLEQARGNPLALLELPAHLGGRAGDQAVDDLIDQHGVSLPRRLQQLYGARIAALSDGVRAELLMGALDGVGTEPGGGPPGVRYRMHDADEAVAAGLLDIKPTTGDLTFRHPLVRSAVVQMATPNQRRAAHQALSQVHRENLERRATHLAAATLDPDEDVADILEAAAESATRRGGALTAVTWLTRAAELSENHTDRSRRLADAAFVAGHAARLGQAHRLVVSGLTPGQASSPTSVLASAYQALYQDGDVRSTQRQVMAAIEQLRDGRSTEPEEVLTRLVILLLAISQYAGEHPTWQRTHELLVSLGDVVTGRTRIYSAAWSDVIRYGAECAGVVEQATANLPALEPWEVSRLAVSAYHLDILSQYRPYLQRVVDRELETGAAASGVVMLHLIMLDQMAVGEWDEAEGTGQRSLDLAAEYGHALFAVQSRAYLAQLAAMRGQVGRARDLQAEVDAWARPRGVGFLTQLADSAGATAALSAGDYEAAYLYAIGITPPGTFLPYTYQASRTLLDLVEAARHTGRVEQARVHALAARDAGLPELSPRLALITHGALAMTADSEPEAAEMFARAESHPDVARFPFELARIRLAHGIRVRHVQGRVTARQYLVPAAEAFERLGAVGWAERARAELRAAGTPPRASTLDLASLTWQERRIADLAAGGLTNKEIGERMHLSPRTVGSHLYRVFPKLGITTRAALRDALSRTEEVSQV
ncbi:helix-turn-helix transcriptional regulator [Streptomyces botrytidirepellens]|uniref:Helix-turn-helix transcriptional regulator n=1 Tax=Streptomyces botrytidirepellens TaxID=2486417 RepID=A0A3M8W071_9ACTN|nr:LuxR family transcriptional regulator [Streptomyces botrytidirepellens]RNG23528.1 helix-turn-helix transcriptional regulator [Streptomyces botrytidirepellens]